MSAAVRIYEQGGPEVLRVEDAAVGRPGPGQVRLRQEAIGLNFRDLYERSGLYPRELPGGLGLEAAGVVEEVGPGCELAPGERVAYGLGPPGAYATERIIDARWLVRLPESIDFETAAAVMLKGMTVEYLVRRAFPVQAGQWVLLHSAAGGVGLIACQWLRALGSRVIGTVGSEEKAELARAHGCEHPVVRQRESFSDRVRDLTGARGVDVVYDSIGRATVEESLDCLRPRGTLVSFGNSSGKPPPLDLIDLLRRGSLYVTRPGLDAYVGTREELEESAASLFAMIERGSVRVEVRQRWPLSEVGEAHRALEARRTSGSSILVP